MNCTTPTESWNTANGSKGEKYLSTTLLTNLHILIQRIEVALTHQIFDSIEPLGKSDFRMSDKKFGMKLVIFSESSKLL